jgi:ribosomal protein L9
LKQVGEHPVTIALHTDVTAHVTVAVAADTAQN